ncbi:PD40 domain-containing protein [candidate division KSB1 bacterium]|nr:PD40 domain-containing protein [candidate division KSB1 bacterium]
MRRKLFIALALSFASTSSLFSQSPPGTEIYLVKATFSQASPQFGAPLNVTMRRGYDNQPAFLPDGSGLLYSSFRDDGQSDIYRYQIVDRATFQITKTIESEYSPTLMPGGKYVSVVRVDADSMQRLWKYPLDGRSPPSRVLEMDGIGYHAWIDDHTLALFILGNPPALQIRDTQNGNAQIISSNTGRCLQKIPGREAISFVHKISAHEWLIKQFDIETRQTAPLLQTLAGSEDYAWTPVASLLMAHGSKLYQWHPSRDKDWQEIADFAEAGLSSITRLAVSPKGDWLALVAAETSVK